MAPGSITLVFGGPRPVPGVRQGCAVHGRGHRAVERRAASSCGTPSTASSPDGAADPEPVRCRGGRRRLDLGGVGGEDEAGLHGPPRGGVELRHVVGVGRVERGEGGPVERRRRAEQAARLGLPGGRRPVRVAMGTSSSGVRIPPRALPRASRRMVGWAPEVSSRRGRVGRRRAGPDPPVERGDGGVEHPVLGTGIGRRRAADDGEGGVLGDDGRGRVRPPVVGHPDDRRCSRRHGTSPPPPSPGTTVVRLAVGGVPGRSGRSRSRRPGRARRGRSGTARGRRGRAIPTATSRRPTGCGRGNR